MRSNKVGWLLLAPTLALLGIFGILPFIYVLYLAFHQWNPFGANPDQVFIGANNFRRLVFDAEFLLSLWVTLKFAFFAVGSEIVDRLPARPALHARVPRPRRLPHHPHPAADRRPDRRRLGLAADDDALASASSPTTSTPGSAST